MSSTKEMEELRDQLRNMADNVDEIINICKKEETGEDVTQEYEAAMGKFVINMMKLQGSTK